MRKRWVDIPYRTLFIANFPRTWGGRKYLGIKSAYGINHFIIVKAFTEGGNLTGFTATVQADMELENYEEIELEGVE
jgi:hypothetical protein